MKGHDCTGFPRCSNLKYHLYRHSFPLAALGRYLRQGSQIRCGIGKAYRVGQTDRAAMKQGVNSEIP